jgi:predicted phosphodiesterase
MRLGLLADIHEAVDLLREALALFRRHGVDEVVSLGDFCEMHQHLDETVRLLRDAGAVGVWGNHDFGLCQPTGTALDGRFAAEVLAWTTSMQPHLVRDDCLFTHVEPWLDGNDLVQLWYFEGLPDTPEKLARSFDAVPQRVLFSGHVHRWFLASPRGPIDWDGRTPIHLRPPERYYLVVDALVHGRCAIYETTTGELTPLTLSGPVRRDSP